MTMTPTEKAEVLKATLEAMQETNIVRLRGLAPKPVDQTQSFAKREALRAEHIAKTSTIKKDGTPFEARNDPPEYPAGAGIIGEDPEGSYEPDPGTTQSAGVKHPPRKPVEVEQYAGEMDLEQLKKNAETARENWIRQTGSAYNGAMPK